MFGRVAVVMFGRVAVVRFGRVAVVRFGRVAVVRFGRVAVVRFGRVAVVRFGRVAVVRFGRVAVVRFGRVRGEDPWPVMGRGGGWLTEAGRWLLCQSQGSPGHARAPVAILGRGEIPVVRRAEIFTKKKKKKKGLGLIHDDRIWGRITTLCSEPDIHRFIEGIHL